MCRMRKRHLLFFCLVLSSPLALLPTTAAAQGTTSNVTIGMLTDSPARLDGVDYLPWQIFGVVPGGYALAFDGMTAGGLPPESAIDALAFKEGSAGSSLGIIAFSVDITAVITGVGAGTITIGSADIVLYANGFSIALDANSMGIPESANIDALARAETGEWIVSFDAPVTMGPWTIQPADLVLATAAGLSPYLTGATLGLGPGVNVIGFERNPGPIQDELYFTFDTPVTVGASTFLPGQIVKYADGAFSAFFSDPQFPPESALTDFSFPPSPGEVPDGFAVPGVPLSVQTAPGGDIRLTWGAACIPSGTDYAVYEGVIGSWYSHASRLCTTGGSTAAVLSPGSGSRYYLVVPVNGMFEGSYGRTSSGLQRPVGGAACVPQKLATPICP